MARARLGDYLVGVEGLALLRHWLGGDPAAAQERIAEIDRFLRDPGLLEAGLDVPELDAHAGYAAWSGRYDELPNPLIRLEEPVVRRLLDDLPPGRALDAACGTGRHAQYLRGRGHRVVGVDASAEMLARARAKLPDVDFRLGALSALPLETASVDLAVCALSLMHVAELGPPVAELARVVRPGGRLVVSDFHPTMLLLGGRALFEGEGGQYGVVRHHRHQHADFLVAFSASGLAVRRCVEPAWGSEEVAILAGPLTALAPAAFAAAFVGVPAAIVWELERP